VTVFLLLMDFPLDRMSEFMSWTNAMIKAPDLPPRVEALRNIKAYLLDAIAERRRNPIADFLSHVLKGEVLGRPLTDIEVLGISVNVFLGGLDTVANAAAWHFKHLATHPEDQARLRANPSLIPIALEELLRAFANVSLHRVCVKEIEMRGIKILPGDLVAVSTPLACRDPAAYDRPNEVIFDRAPTHITFAYGPHHCVGSHLARRELLIALEEFLARTGEFRVAPGAILPMHFGEVMGLDALPLVWNV
jgi:cytochrome P450